MSASKLEQQLLKEKNNLIVGTSCVGLNNYVGPLVSCSVVLNYNKLDPILNNLLAGSLPVNLLKNVLKSIKYYATKITTLAELNSIGDSNTGVYYSNFCSVNKLVWKILTNKEVPTVFITDTYDLKEVVKSSYDSLHSANKRVSDYMVWDNPPTLNMLAPKADYYKTNARKTALCVKVAKALAQLVLNQELDLINKTIPQYNILQEQGKKQVSIVSKLGNTQYHRLYLKDLAKYPINTLVLKGDDNGNNN